VRAEDPLTGRSSAVGQPPTRPMSPLTLFLCGDVMTGRGIDQVLPHPAPPHLFEPHVRSARDYVALAEEAHGHIPRRADWPYPWGDALEELDRVHPDVRIINLETAATTSEDAEPKGINYRMSPRNVPVLTAARIDCCTLANNHVLDWGEAGLLETVEALTGAGIRVTGAGHDLAAAQAPAVLDARDGARVLVFAFAATDAGIPETWGASSAHPGVDLLPDFSDGTAARIATRVAAVKRSGDVAVASIHWGPNWGYGVPAEHRHFAHALIDRARIDIVYGHSSHHPMGIEVHDGHVILYGCGDFLNDYEGIPGNERFRGDLALMYFPSLDAGTGRLTRLAMTPMQIRNFRLRHPTHEDRTWLHDTLDRECRRLGTHVVPRGERFVLE
jgi:poly-gamma-glutamate capsule biosynthesis protein CapA/YwtB (metallophosphatase superfamily)